MQKFTKVCGVAAPFPTVNVDTDMIIPKDFMKSIRRTGLGKGLFAAVRYFDDGTPDPGFVLNKPLYRDAEILVVGDNFGCGSSREHAPWALLDFGIRCLISTSFADIFHSNCLKNGILPIKLGRNTIDALMNDASQSSNAIFTVDLENLEITCPSGKSVRFNLEGSARDCLLKGLDDIDMTLEKTAMIDLFEETNFVLHPWTR